VADRLVALHLHRYAGMARLRIDSAVPLAPTQEAAFRRVAASLPDPWSISVAGEELLVTRVDCGAQGLLHGAFSEPSNAVAWLEALRAPRK